MRSPVSAYSLASCRLVSSGHVTGPPSAATSPTITCGSARCALSAMNTMSDSATRLQPSPTAGPLTAATIGTRHRDHAGHDLPAVRRASRGAAPASVAQLVEVVEVAAGRERPPVAGEHDGPGLEVGVDLREQLGQPLVQLVVGGVELRRAG